MTNRLRGLLHTIKLQMKLSMARPMFRFVVLLQPFLFASIGYLIYGGSSAEQLFHYVVLGSGFVTLWSSILFSSASDINRERYYGTLEIIFVSPTSFAVTIMGKIIGNMIWGLFSMLISFFYLLLIFQVQMQMTHLWIFLLALFFVLISLSIFSFFLAMWFTISRQATTLMNMMEFPIYLLCGFLFPITILPSWIQPLSWLLPPTWSIQLLREVSKSSLQSTEVLKCWSWLVSVTLLFLILGILFYRVLDKRVRKIGNLGVY